MELKLLIYGCLCLGVVVALEVIFKVWINPITTADDPSEVFYKYHAAARIGLGMYWALISFLCLLFINRIRLSYIFGAGTAIFSLIIMFSRHWWISFMFSTLLALGFTLKENRERIFSIISLVMCLIFLILGAALLKPERMTLYLNLIGLRAKSLTFQEKIQNWEVRKIENKYAVKKILSHPVYPLTGIGFSRPYRPSNYSDVPGPSWYLHNGFLWIFLKMGFFGFIPFLWFSYIFVKRGIIKWRKVEDNFFKAIVLASVVTYLGIAPGNLASPHFIETWEVAIFGLMFGVNEVIYRIEGINERPKLHNV